MSFEIEGSGLLISQARGENVSLYLTRVRIGTLANARGLRFDRILKWVHVINYVFGNERLH